jgi:hypothetical protein
MKHPSYSRATNQYAGRSFTKLSSEGKVAHKKTMKEFVERLKKLSK